MYSYYNPDMSFAVSEICQKSAVLDHVSNRCCCFVVRGESPGCRLITTASMLEWLRNLLPTTHRGAVRKDGVEIP